MQRFKILISAFLCTCALGLSAAEIVKNGNCVTITPELPKADGAKVVCLQVVNDNIIRVRATSENALPEKNSLIIVPQKGKPQFSVDEDAQKVYVKAKNVQAGLFQRVK